MPCRQPLSGTWRHGLDDGSDSEKLELDLFANFRNAVTEALALAMLVAFVVALVLSLFVSRRVVVPVQEMMVCQPADRRRAL